MQQRSYHRQNGRSLMKAPPAWCDSPMPVVIWIPVT
jgi:hypothetical protein